MPGDGFMVIENTQEAISKVCSPWGNSSVTMELSDIFALLQGKLLYHFDGEYGTFIELNPDIPICNELKALAEREENNDETLD